MKWNPEFYHFKTFQALIVSHCGKLYNYKATSLNASKHLIFALKDLMTSSIWKLNLPSSSQNKNYKHQTKTPVVFVTYFTIFQQQERMSSTSSSCSGNHPTCFLFSKSRVTAPSTRSKSCDPSRSAPQDLALR